MKKPFVIILLASTFLIHCAKEKGDNHSPSALPLFRTIQPGPQAEDAEFTTTLAQSYWYARYNMDAFALRSRNGAEPTATEEVINEIREIFEYDLPEMVTDRVSSQSPSTPVNYFLLARVFDRGTPFYENPEVYDPFDFDANKWRTSLTDSQETSWESWAWTLISEVEWAKHFHDETLFGSLEPLSADAGSRSKQERYWGVWLFGQAVIQVLEWSQHPELFSAQTAASRYLALRALSRLMTAMTSGIPHCNTGNRLTEVAHRLAAAYGIGNIEEFITQRMTLLYNDLPEELTTPEEIHIALDSLTDFAHINRNERDRILAQFHSLARKLIDLEATTFMDRVHLVGALFQAHRTLHDIIYLQRAIPLANSILESYEGGSFDGKINYTTAEISWIIRDLNLLRLFGGSFVDQEKIRQMFTDFFNEVVNKGGLQLSAFGASQINEFEREEESHHRHSAIPMPREAGNHAEGNSHGMAPVFASSIEKNSAGEWHITEIRFTTAEAMHLASELLWLHHEKVDGFQ